MVSRQSLLRSFLLWISAIAYSTVAMGEDQSFHSVVAIFPPDKNLKHNHASCIVEYPNGDFLTAWYRGSGERRSDDVRIVGSRLRKGETRWSETFELADVPDYPDCNPALFVGTDQSLWLFWPTILDNRWEGALLKFAKSVDYQKPGTPIWVKEGVIHVTPSRFEEDMKAAIDQVGAAKKLPVISRYFQSVEERYTQKIYQRLGWMPRVRPIALPTGRWLLPLYTDTFSVSLMAITDDQGKTWKSSRPIIGWGNIQPAVVRRNDGSLVAYMRENGATGKIRVSESRDQGESWSPVTSSELPNPGAGVDAIRLRNGHWALTYNDTVKGRHSLAVAISEDEGRTWKHLRHAEKKPVGQGSFHYPSILQASDGAIHLTYTSSLDIGETISHARFNEEWIRQGDSKP